MAFDESLFLAPYLRIQTHRLNLKAQSSPTAAASAHHRPLDPTTSSMFVLLWIN